MRGPPPWGKRVSTAAPKHPAPNTLLRAGPCPPSPSAWTSGSLDLEHGERRAFRRGSAADKLHICRKRNPSKTRWSGFAPAGWRRSGWKLQGQAHLSLFSPSTVFPIRALKWGGSHGIGKASRLSKAEQNNRAKSHGKSEGWKARERPSCAGQAWPVRDLTTAADTQAGGSYRLACAAWPRGAKTRNCPLSAHGGGWGEDGGKA